MVIDVLLRCFKVFLCVWVFCGYRSWKSNWRQFPIFNSEHSNNNCLLQTVACLSLIARVFTLHNSMADEGRTVLKKYLMSTGRHSIHYSLFNIIQIVEIHLMDRKYS